MRKLRVGERKVIQALLLSADAEYAGHLHELEELRVDTLDDGAMGSIRFLSKDEQTRGKTIVEAEFLDADNVLVFLYLDVDMDGELFELGVFKADFSALKTWPLGDDLNIKEQ